MRLLLDTHALLWWSHEPEKLSAAARAAIADGDNDVIVSAVSAMEIATKNRIGTLGYSTSLADRFVDIVTAHGFSLASISCEHAQHAGGFDFKHRDPWDRMLAAQAQIEGVALVTVDRAFEQLNVQTLW